MPNLISLRNKSQYPGRSPGFDPAHLAAPNCRFSAVSSSSNFISLLRGARGAISGIPTSATTFPSTSSTAVNSFAGQSTVNDTSITIASVLQWIDTTASSIVFTTASTNAGWRLNIASSGTISLTTGAVTDLPGIAISTKVPYFVVVSANANNVNYVLLRLDNGVITTLAGTGSSPNAPNGTYQVGNISAFNLPAKASMAAVMFSATYLPITTLLQWANDPWSFWYPSVVENRISISLTTISAAAFQAAFVRNRNFVNQGIAT